MRRTPLLCLLVLSAALAAPSWAASVTTLLSAPGIV